MRILFVTARPPWPGRRGDQARAAGLVRELAARHQVRVVAQQWPGFESVAGPPEAPPPGVELRTVAIGRPQLALSLAAAVLRPVQVALHRHRAFRRAVVREARDFRPDVAVLVLSRIGDLLADLQDVPVVVDLIDALALNMARRAARQTRLRGLWRWEGRRMARWDRRVVRACRLATVVADRDRRALLEEDETVAAKVKVVPFGLALQHQEPLVVARRPIVALTGNLGYFPTVEGALWFGRRIWPRVRELVPAAEWWLAGARPAAAVRRLESLPGVRLFVEPEDLTSILHQAAVAIAPLRSGSGTPIKILEAMALSVPVVATFEGGAGLDELPAGALQTADDPETFAGAVAGLLSDPEAARRQSLEARRWLQARHDLELVGKYFEEVLVEAAEGSGGS